MSSFTLYYCDAKKLTPKDVSFDLYVLLDVRLELLVLSFETLNVALDLTDLNIKLLLLAAEALCLLLQCDDL